MKKLISLVVIIAICLAVSGVTTFATVNAPQGCRPGPNMGTQVDYEARNEKFALQEARRQQENAQKNVARAEVTWVYLTDFVCETQLEPAFCMAACAQSVLNFLNSTSYNQYTVATALNVDPINGGYFENLTPYLNSMQNANFYVQRIRHPNAATTPDPDDSVNPIPIADMKYDLYSAITVFEAPPVMRINTTAIVDDWLYTTSGHAICIRGVRIADKGSFQIADPLRSYLDPSKGPNFKRASDIIHAAISPEYCGYTY